MVFTEAPFTRNNLKPITRVKVRKVMECSYNRVQSSFFFFLNKVELCEEIVKPQIS